MELSQGKRHFRDIRLIGLDYPYFTFHDKEYADFINMVLQGLEDRTYQKGHQLIEELQECYEVRFVQEGTFDVGFEVNRKKYYKLRFGKSAIIGGYQICFRSRYLFTYKASSLLKAYSLRLRMWIKIKQKYPAFIKSIREKFVDHYVNKIFRPMMKQKKLIIDLFDVRKDYT